MNSVLYPTTESDFITLSFPNDVDMGGYNKKEKEKLKKSLSEIASQFFKETFDRIPKEYKPRRIRTTSSYTISMYRPGKRQLVKLDAVAEEFKNTHLEKMNLGRLLFEFAPSRIIEPADEYKIEGCLLQFDLGGYEHEGKRNFVLARYARSHEEGFVHENAHVFSIAIPFKSLTNQKKDYFLTSLFHHELKKVLEPQEHIPLFYGLVSPNFVNDRIYEQGLIAYKIQPSRFSIRDMVTTVTNIAKKVNNIAETEEFSKQLEIVTKKDTSLAMIDKLERKAEQEKYSAIKAIHELAKQYE